MTSGPTEPRLNIQPKAANEGIHSPFLLTSLALAVLAGFSLAVSLPIEAALGRLDIGWLSHAQVHGHLQVIGFAGLFVLGVAARLIPRFGGRPLAGSGLLIAAFWFIVAGLLARSLGQPLADHTPFAALMMAGSISEALGALVALVVVARTLRPWSAGTTPSAVLLTASMTWLTVQAGLGVWWLLELANEGGIVLGGTENMVLLQVQVFGFLLSALIGVGIRSFPSFFGARLPEGRWVWSLVGLLQVGLLVWMLGLLWVRQDGDGARAASAAGQLAVGAALVGIAIAVGWWRRGNRLAPASRHFAWSLRMILGWLTVTGVLLAATAASALLDGSLVSTLQIDAIRHIFLIGVITLGISVMGQLILPEFASERLVRSPGAWRGWVFGVALSTAALFRGVLPLAGVEGDARYWLMAVAGLTGLGAIALFAWLYLRARNSHRQYLMKIAGLRRQQVPMA